MSDFSDPEFESKTLSGSKDNNTHHSPLETINKVPIDEFTEKLLVYLALCKLGDKTAFTQLYQLSAAKLNGIAYRITRNIDSANEVLQDTFIDIWQHSDQYQARQNEPFTWLVSFVRYRAYERLRYDRYHTQNNFITFDEANIDDFYNAFGEFDPINSSKDTLNSCLAKLEQKQSKAILMAYLYGYNYKDMIAYFTSPSSTIKSWIRRGIRKLKICLTN